MQLKSCDVVAAILVAFVFVSVKNFARADTWDGGNNTGGGWSTNVNWLDNTEPTINDPAVFPTPIPFGDSTISCSATEFAASLTFNDSYAIGANFLQLGTGAISVASGKTATINSVLTGTAGLSKSGTGTLVLTGANTFSGAVSFPNSSGGIVSVRANNNLGNAANAINLASGTLRFAPNGSNQTISISRAITIGALGATVEVTGVNPTIQLPQAIGGSVGTLDIRGNGSLHLSASSARTASNRIFDCVVRLNHAAALGTGSMTLGSDPLVGEIGTIEIPNGVTLTNFVTMNNNGAMRSVGALGVFGGTCTITGTGRFYGGLTATDTLRIGNVGSALSGSPGTLAIIEGPGTVQTNVSNNYQGDWRIDSGTLRVGHSGGFGPGTTPVVVNSGANLIVESRTLTRPVFVNDFGMLTIGTNLTASADITLSHSGDPLSSSTLGGGVFQLMLDGGNFTVDHGTSSTGSGFVGFSPTSTAGASLSDDATWNLSGSLSVGHEGQGTLSVASGSDVSNLIAHIGSVGGSTGSATVSGSGSTWASSGFLGVGYSGTGTLNIENGGSVSAASSFVAADPGSSGEVNITGAGSTWSVTGSPVIGEHGDGAMTLAAGGTVTDSGAFIGRFADGVGHVTVSGADSIWTNSGALIVGASGLGTLGVEAGGRVTSTGDCQIGSSGGSDGEVTVTGAGSTFVSGDLYVGFQGTGALSVFAGATVTAADSSIGGASSPEGSVATVSGVGSSWNSSGDLVVGDGGDGFLNIAAGGNVASGTSTIGRLNVGDGSATVTGTGSTWTNSNLAVGYLGGHGELSVLDGAVVTSQQGSVGNSSGTGNAVISGTGSTWNIAGALSLGFNGAGTLLVDSGGSFSTSLASLGFGNGSTATATLSGAGSAWTCGVFGLELGANDANATLNVLGGTLNCNGDITDGGAGISTLTLDGGAIDMQNHAIGGVMPIDMLSFRSGALKNVTQINNGAGLTKTSGGTLLLNGPNSYTGATAIEEGTLHVSNTTGSATGVGVVTVAESAALMGTGRIAGLVVNNGLVAPGASAGVLTLQNSFAQSESGSLMIQIGGTTVGSEYDRLAVAGIATLQGTLDVSLIEGFEPQVDQTFIILTCSLRSGQFNQVTGMQAGAGKAFQVQYNSGNVTLAVVASASGDMNCDGAFNLLDAAPFALALTDLDAFAAQFPGCDPLRGDMNQDGELDGLDISAMVECLVLGGCP